MQPPSPLGMGSRSHPRLWPHVKDCNGVIETHALLGAGSEPGLAASAPLDERGVLPFPLKEFRQHW